MRKSKFTPEQIPQPLRQAEGATAVADMCRNDRATQRLKRVVTVEKGVRVAGRPRVA